MWLSSGDQYLLLAAPVLAFLAFILKICLISKIVRLETAICTKKSGRKNYKQMMDRKINPIETWPRNLGQILAIYLEAFSRRMILPMAVLLLELESTGPNFDHIGSRSLNSDEKMG